MTSVELFAWLGAAFFVLIYIPLLIAIASVVDDLEKRVSALEAKEGNDDR